MFDLAEKLRTGFVNVAQHNLRESNLGAHPQLVLVAQELVNAGFLLSVDLQIPPSEYTRILRLLAANLDQALIALAKEQMENEVGSVTEWERTNQEILSDTADDMLDDPEGTPIVVKP